MTTFTIDTEYTRRLAQELFEASQGSNPPLPTLPQDPPVAGFSALLGPALSNLAARTSQLRTDLGVVAESSRMMADDADAADGSLASGLDAALSAGLGTAEWGGR